jgi:hypothetical protein
MREAEDSGVSRCEGLGTAGWGKPGGTISNWISRRKEVKYPAAARTSPTRPHHGSWTSQRRRVLGDNGQVQSEVGGVRA